MENLTQISNGQQISSIKNHGNEFIQISQTQINSIVKILEERLPRSGHVYNCALRLSKHWDEFPLYTLNGDVTSTAWILINIKRPGLSQTICISPPPNAKITPELKQAFIYTNAINWDKAYLFTGVDRVVSPLIAEISSFVKGNGTNIYPHFYFYVSREDALQFNVTTNGKDVSLVKPLDEEGTNFIINNWKYSGNEGEGMGDLEYAEDIVAKHPSCGVYVNGQPVSGVATHSEILIGLLATDPGHRNKGYALLCMKSLISQLANEGYLPSSCVENRNRMSKEFHMKCGMTFSHDCDYIWFAGNLTW